MQPEAKVQVFLPITLFLSPIASPARYYQTVITQAKRKALYVWVSDIILNEQWTDY